MDLYEGNIYWDKTIEPPYHFEKLTSPLKTGVLIVGGGMSGTLCANVLASAGLEVTIIEKNKIGEGSSAANTGLLQYTSDKMLSELADELGEENAVLFYKMCLEAMDQLTLLNHQLESETDYKLRESIYYASSQKDKEKLQREYDYLTKHQFPVEFLDAEELRNRFKIDKPCALRTWHDAEVNPFKFIHAVTEANVKLGVNYYEHTAIAIEQVGEHEACTEDGVPIQFDHLIFTTGYANLFPAIKDKAAITRTYALATEPIEKNLWQDDVLVWETKDPYLYFRTTADNRIIAGGLDEEKDEVEHDEALILQKAKEIVKQIEAIFPKLTLNISHAWTALFGTSKDGLPFMGRDPKQSNIYYLLGFEGNGTCYSMAGSNILKDLITGKPNPYEEIVKVDRTY